MSTRIDAHQHFWLLDRGDYGWLKPQLETLYRNYQPADLAPLLKDAGIDKTILVQAAPTLAETRYLLDLADQHDFIAGVVGWVDMEDGEDGADTVADLAIYPKFLGIRPMLQDIDEPDWITMPELAPVTEALIEQHLTFDALVKTEHLPYLFEYLENHPDLPVIIDHGAKPSIATGAWQPWADDIARIASATGAYCKISGLITEADSSQSVADLERYLDHLLESFGPKRLVWGSDWPVLNLAGDYAGWHAATQKWLSQLSETEQDGIMGLNAAHFYGLQDD